MRVLLDTHTFLWAISDDSRLGAVSRSLIFDQAERVLLSHISLWEIAIKHALARADMPVSAAEASSWADASGFLIRQQPPRSSSRPLEWYKNTSAGHVRQPHPVSARDVPSPVH